MTDARHKSRVCSTGWLGGLLFILGTVIVAGLINYDESTTLFTIFQKEHGTPFFLENVEIDKASVEIEEQSLLPACSFAADSNLSPNAVCFSEKRDFFLLLIGGSLAAILASISGCLYAQGNRRMLSTLLLILSLYLGLGADGCYEAGDWHDLMRFNWWR